ncbi:MAG: anaerobic sulfatase maturase [Kiritimatiellia bacterium]
MNSEPYRPFSLLIKPACGDCNLRCDYCFYLRKRALYPGTRRHRMDPETQEAMISGYMRTSQPNYTFGWQGGEPTLMGLDFFRLATDLQAKYGRDGAAVSNGLQTNATLIDSDFAAYLREYNYLVGVSLDGPEKTHDRYRKHGNGRGTHADVMTGIGHLRENNVDFNILTLVSASNVRKPGEIYRYLTGEGFLFQQYIECVEFNEDGGLLPYSVSAGEWGDFLCGIYDEWYPRDTRTVSIRLFDSIVTRLVNGQANLCAMGRDCRQYFVVEHNGDVYPCDFFVQPELYLGNVKTGSWSDFRNSRIYRDFGARKSSWNEACAECPYLDFCAGDCPKNRSPEGRDPGRLSVLCEGWKQFYDHTLDGFKKLADEVCRERSRPRINPADYPDVGRNDPCPCGSGKKFKKCCGSAG